MLRIFDSRFYAVSAALLFSACPLMAQSPSATATITDVPSTGGVYNYSLQLTNTSPAQTIGTFWFAWVPGENFLLDQPTNVLNPAGWSDSVIAPGGFDAGGYSIMWTTANPLVAGGTLDFGFSSLETPAQLAGNSSFFSNPSVPEATSTIYSGAAFTTPSDTFVAGVIPEPSTQEFFLLNLGLFPLLFVGLTWRRSVVGRLK